MQYILEGESDNFPPSTYKLSWNLFIELKSICTCFTFIAITLLHPFAFAWFLLQCEAVLTGHPRSSSYSVERWDELALKLFCQAASQKLSDRKSMEPSDKKKILQSHLKETTYKLKDGLFYLF